MRAFGRPFAFATLALTFGVGALVSAQTRTPATRPPVAKASAATLLAKGEAALAAGRDAEALRLGDAVVAGYPKRWEGPRLVARAAFALDQPDRAETAYRSALRLAPTAERPALQKGLTDVAALRQALRYVARSRALAADGQIDAAAESQERAYRALPARYTLGLAAADLFEKAESFDDAERVLRDVLEGELPLSKKAETRTNLARLEAAHAVKRQAATEERERRESAERKASEARAAEAERRAAEAERKRVEAERKAEDDRQREERARFVREETDRLNGVLSTQRSEVSGAEGAVRDADGAVSDAQRAVDDTHREEERARSRRDSAKGEVDEWRGKVDDAKGDIAKDIARDKLRQAEGRYNDAKGDYDRAESRHDDANARLNSARSGADTARRNLEVARANVRDTEAALSRLASGG